MSPYAGIIALTIAATGFFLFMLLLSYYLGPKNKTKTKQQPFECGSIPVGDVRNRRSQIRFYLVAVLFILFDIEIVFMYPWAVNIKQLGWPGFYAVLTFVMVLSVGLVYVWRKGVLDWND